MKITELMSNYVFKNLTSLGDGTTIEDVKKVLSGLDTELAGLSEAEKVKVFEDTPFLKSHLDGRIGGALTLRETELNTNFETERKTLNTQITDLRTKLPVDDVETLKQTWLDASAKDKETARNAWEFAEMKQRVETIEKEKNESNRELKEAKLIEVVRSQLGERKLPDFIKLSSFIGADEKETKERMTSVVTQFDDFIKGVNTNNVNTQTPPDGGNIDYDLASEMDKVGKF